MRILKMTEEQFNRFEDMSWEQQIDFKIELMREQEQREEKTFFAYLRSLSLKRPELRKACYEYLRATENL